MKTEYRVEVQKHSGAVRVDGCGDFAFSKHPTRYDSIQDLPRWMQERIAVMKVMDMAISSPRVFIFWIDE